MVHSMEVSIAGTARTKRTIQRRSTQCHNNSDYTFGLSRCRVPARGLMPGDMAAGRHSYDHDIARASTA